ncbi:4-hydroxyphenylpyruvate dioxygenase [Nocardia sp. NPDC005745]|uniref:4-hydroxyphenylpyruvate dioxygenase n=1 Tax=Nocardia sp. NPDC005745 TaxID=3157061 RepID=UPI0033F472CD
MQTLREVRLDHVEFYVGDIEAFAREFVTNYGFQIAGKTSADTGGHRSLALRQGGIVILLTEGLDHDSPVSAWVRAHGDGVANIWLRTPAVHDVLAEAMANGATVTLAPRERAGVVTAGIGAFGDIQHGLVERPDDADSGQLPPGIVPVETAGAESPVKFGVLDHFAYLVNAGDLGSAVKFYESVLDFSVIFQERTLVDGQGMDSKVVQNAAGDVTFTIVESAAAPGQALDFIAAFVRDHGGPGVQHVAFGCDDIVTTVQDLRDQGVDFLDTPGTYYDMLPERLGDVRHNLDQLRGLSILADKDHAGELFQIFTRSTHPRKTFFVEVIERFGAETFGKGNVKALFEAKKAERDQLECQ